MKLIINRLNPISIPISLLFLLLQPSHPATVSWTGGVEDTFFCGYKWDEANCRNRQHCPSGRNEECEFFSEGQKCFANSPCDARYGDGSGYVPGKDFKPSVSAPTVPLTPRPTYTGISEDPTDHRWCGKGLDEAKTCVQHCPTGDAKECPQGMICFPDITVCDARNIVPDTMRPTPELTPEPTISLPPMGGPTPIPTDVPIEPPDPLPFPSDDPTDHWFCGIGLDDTNKNCETHCPTANECPVGQICYFGTQCDGRTHEPTPPPTRRPTAPPTNHPTNHPTNSVPPSISPTTTKQPSAAPSIPVPTKTPTKSPTGRPTWAPLPALQLTFFCGANWNDAVDNCKKRCPTGEDTECPEGDFCFTGTPCTEEMGYPETDDGGDDDGGQGQACVPFQVTVTADAWPNEISWVIVDTETEEVLAEGGNDELVSGEAYDYPVECINRRKGCYEFTLNDSGGDGLCCGEGQGSYKISYDGKELRTGDVFYDYEKTEFGLCGATETPTKEPTVRTESIAADTPNQQGGGASTSGSDLGYRCVDKSLAERGYKISADKCDLFDNCYNPQIMVGDDWFCDASATCVEADACGVSAVENDNNDSQATSQTPGYRCVDQSLADRGYQIAKDKCDLFDNCYNPQLETGDDWFCDDSSACIEAVPCGSLSSEEAPASEESEPQAEDTSPESEATSDTDLAPEEVEMDEPEAEVAEPEAKTTSAPAASAVASARPPSELLESDTNTPAPIIFIATGTTPAPIESLEPEDNTPTPFMLNSTDATLAPMTSPESESNSQPSGTRPPKDTTNPGNESGAETPEETVDSASALPTLVPTTASPTLGPCGGIPCKERKHCRSKYGFCGPGSTYCNEFAVWTKDCPEKIPTISPTVIPEISTVSPSFSSTSVLTSTGTNHLTSSETNIETAIETNTETNTEINNSTSPPTRKWSKPGGGKGDVTKPSGGKGSISKPSGGKGSITKPGRTNSPTELYPPLDYPLVNQPESTDHPSPYPIFNPIDSEPPSPYPVSGLATMSPTFGQIFDTRSPTFLSYSTDQPSTSYALTHAPSDVTEDLTQFPTPSPSVSTTSNPTSSPTLPAVTPPPTVVVTAKATNEYTCTGDRCPIDSQCRSRYGTCGPGFIYCNEHSTWTSTCPPPIPGVTPTRSPTAKPTSDATDINTKFTSVNKPTFARSTLPPIARPTLTTITDAVPFEFGMSMPGNFGLDFAETDKVETDDDYTDDNIDTSESVTPDTKPVDPFQTAEYLDLWADLRESSSQTFCSTWFNILTAMTTVIYLLIELP